MDRCDRGRLAIRWRGLLWQLDGGVGVGDDLCAVGLIEAEPNMAVGWDLDVELRSPPGDDLDAPPYDELDRGIVELVRLFYEADFEPTDSGDGLSKLGGEMDGDDGCILSFPHVVLMCKSSKLIEEVDRVFDILRERTSLHIDEFGGWWVEGTYDRRGRSTILVRGPKGWWPECVNIDGTMWTVPKPAKGGR